MEDPAAEFEWGLGCLMLTPARTASVCGVVCAMLSPAIAVKIVSERARDRIINVRGRSRPKGWRGKVPLSISHASL